MVRNEFTFPSADGRTGIHAVEWTPDMAPRAVLVLSHGVSEHILRYEPLAAYLTEWGFAVAGHDHLGHGLSVAAGAPRLYFGPRGSWDWAVQDLYARRELAGQWFPGLPVFLLGHSMGSFLARTYLIRYPGTVAGAILMGTGQMPPALVAAGRQPPGGGRAAALLCPSDGSAGRPDLVSLERLPDLPCHSVEGVLPDLAGEQTGRWTSAAGLASGSPAFRCSCWGIQSEILLAGANRTGYPRRWWRRARLRQARERDRHQYLAFRIPSVSGLTIGLFLGDALSGSPALRSKRT